jgi:hypothetical protein
MKWFAPIIDFCIMALKALQVFLVAPFLLELRDEPTFLKTVQCTVLVGEMSEWQQVPRTVTELAVVLAANEKATHRLTGDLLL